MTQNRTAQDFAKKDSLTSCKTLKVDDYRNFELEKQVSEPASPDKVSLNAYGQLDKCAIKSRRQSVENFSINTDVVIFDQLNDNKTKILHKPAKELIRGKNFNIQPAQSEYSNPYSNSKMLMEVQTAEQATSVETHRRINSILVDNSRLTTLTSRNSNRKIKGQLDFVDSNRASDLSSYQDEPKTKTTKAKNEQERVLRDN